MYFADHGGRQPIDAQRAQETVGVQRRRAEHFRQPAGGDVPVHFHLPQTVLRMHKPQGEIGVVQGLGIYMRMALLSRMISTGADRPGRVMVPEVCGSDWRT
ncbi:MAG: hypothetical protein WDN04_01530 [Rhodospirillales bacterium]